MFFFFFMQFLRTFFNANVIFNKSRHYTTYRECIFRENWKLKIENWKLTCFSYMQVRFTSVSNPFQVRSSSNRENGVITEGERRHNGGTTEIENWKLKVGDTSLFLGKNFFTQTLHPYIDTPYILLMHKGLHRFQISSNPTLTLHQPYTNEP